MRDDKLYKARWRPGWYELDQSLIVGRRQKYWFFQTPPADHLDPNQPVDFVFFNQLGSPANCQVRYAKVREILHPQLGRLACIDTDGSNYLFITGDGREIQVNADEEPGAAEDDHVTIADWSVLVTLSDVSDPVTDTA